MLALQPLLRTSLMPFCLDAPCHGHVILFLTLTPLQLDVLVAVSRAWLGHHALRLRPLMMEAFRNLSAIFGRCRRECVMVGSEGVHPITVLRDSLRAQTEAIVLLRALCPQLCKATGLQLFTGHHLALAVALAILNTYPSRACPLVWHWPRLFNLLAECSTNPPDNRPVIRLYMYILRALLPLDAKLHWHVVPGPQPSNEVLFEYLHRPFLCRLDTERQP